MRRIRPHSSGKRKNRRKFLADGWRERISCGGYVRAVREQAETGGNSLPTVCGNEFLAADASAQFGKAQKPAEIRCRRFAGRNFLRRIRPRGFGKRKNRRKFVGDVWREGISCGRFVRAGLGSAETGGNSLPTVGGNEFCAADTSARVWNRLEPAEIRCRRLAGTNFVRRMRPRSSGERRNRRKFVADDLREGILRGGYVRAVREQAKTGGNSLPTFGGNEFPAVDTSAQFGEAQKPAEIRCRRLAGTNFVRRIRPRSSGERRNRRKFVADGLREGISCGGYVRATVSASS